MKTLLWLKAPPAPSGPQRRSRKGLGPGDHGDDDVRGLGQGLGVGGQAGPLLHQGRSLLRAAVIDHDGVAGLQEIGGHGRPHDAQAHESDLVLHITVLRAAFIWETPRPSGPGSLTYYKT